MGAFPVTVTRGSSMLQTKELKAECLQRIINTVNITNTAIISRNSADRFVLELELCNDDANY